MKNRIITILLTAVLAISATACGNTLADGGSSTADVAGQSSDRESTQENSVRDSLEETVEEIVEESVEESGGEQSTGDGDSEAEDGKSFAYMMDDNWHEPSYNEFSEIQRAIGEVLYTGDTYEKFQEWDEGEEGINSIIRRWEEESYEAQGSYTWDQFLYDIYTEYDVPISPKMCKIGDSYRVYRDGGYEEYVVNNWYDKYVYDWSADNLEELVGRIGTNTSSEEFGIIFRIYIHSDAPVWWLGFLLQEEEILDKYNEVKEQYIGNGASETETGKSFAYMMNDDWYEPEWADFSSLMREVGKVMLNLGPFDRYYDESESEVLHEWEMNEGSEVLNNLVLRWEEESYEAQGDYTWEEFEYDICKEYDAPITSGQKCKIGDSYWYCLVDDNGEEVGGEWAVDDWYDKYVCGTYAEYLEELAKRIDIDTSSDAFCGIFRRFLNTCVSVDSQGRIVMLIGQADVKEILAEFGLE